MRIKAEQLAKNLESGKFPIYWISGDEPLLIQESADLVRTHFQNIDFTEREIFNVERGFKWEQFSHTTTNLSLFSEKKIFDVRLRNTKLDQDGKKAIQRFLNDNNPDSILLISSPKLDNTYLNSNWLKTNASHIVLVQIWPINRENLKHWLSQRLAREGINADREALQLLTDKVEGNLLAAIQEIEKLKLLANVTGAGHITLNAKTTMQVIADNSRYNIYNLIDSALLGDTARCLKILVNLKGEGVFPLIILGAITRELRALLPLIEQKERGQGIETIIQSNQVWFNRKKAVAKAVQRGTSDDTWKMLASARKIDQSLKGASSTNPWDEISSLILNLCGQKIPHMTQINPLITPLIETSAF